MNFVDWELINYNLAVERQQELVEQFAAGAPEMIVFCEHPAIVTLGRATKAEDILGWKGDVAETSRGGRATFHGPGQIVVYPILNLKNRNRDLHGYMRSLEIVISQSLHDIGIIGAEARTVQMGELSLTGVWVGSRKIASIGIAVRKWVTYHGCAINFFRESVSGFRGINPCGFQSSVMTSVEDILGNVDANLRDTFKAALRQHFRAQFEQPEVDSAPVIDHAL